MVTRTVVPALQSSTRTPYQMYSKEYHLRRFLLTSLHIIILFIVIRSHRQAGIEVLHPPPSHPHPPPNNKTTPRALLGTCIEIRRDVTSNGNRVPGLASGALAAGLAGAPCVVRPRGETARWSTVPQDLEGFATARGGRNYSCARWECLEKHREAQQTQLDSTHRSF